MDRADNWLPIGAVVARYGVCSKTLDRWADSGRLEFPQPLRINRRRFWRLTDLQDWERAQAASKNREVV
jgi:predicted DNA-binding transcriptional regulator AlpA